MKSLITQEIRGGRITLQIIGVCTVLGTLAINHQALAGVKHYRDADSQTSGRSLRVQPSNSNKGKTLPHHEGGRQLQEYSVLAYDGDCYDRIAVGNLFFRNGVGYAFRDEQIEKLCELPVDNSGAVYFLTNYEGPYNCVKDLFKYEYALNGIDYYVVQPDAYLVNGVPVDIYSTQLPLTMASVTFACSQANDENFVFPSDNNQRAGCIYSSFVDYGYDLDTAIASCRSEYEEIGYEYPTQSPNWPPRPRPNTGASISSVSKSAAALAVLGLAGALH